MRPLWKQALGGEVNGWIAAVCAQLLLLWGDSPRHTLLLRASPCVSAPCNTKAHWQDVQPARKRAAVFNGGSEKWEMGRAAGWIKGRVTGHAFLYWPAKIWLEISHQTLFSSCPFWDMHSSLVHNFAVSKETACCSPHSAPRMTVWLHSVREPIKHCSQNDSAAAWLIAILVNPKGHMNLMMGCSVCFFISAVMMRPRHGVTAWRQPKEKKSCGIAGFKEPIPIITLLRFLKEDEYEKPIS